MVDGKKVRDRRLELGMTMEELGKKIGVNKTTVKRYEENQISSMPYLTFFKLLVALQTTPAHILPKEEYELIERNDELKSFYSSVGEIQTDLTALMKNLPPDDTAIIAALARELSARHKE